MWRSAEATRKSRGQKCHHGSNSSSTHDRALLRAKSDSGGRAFEGVGEAWARSPTDRPALSLSESPAAGCRSWRVADLNSSVDRPRPARGMAPPSYEEPGSSDDLGLAESSGSVPIFSPRFQIVMRVLSQSSGSSRTGRYGSATPGSAPAL